MNSAVLQIEYEVYDMCLLTMNSRLFMFFNKKDLHVGLSFIPLFACIHKCTLAEWKSRNKTYNAVV